MAKSNEQMQVTIPKALAERYGISPGDELELEPAGRDILIRVGRRGPLVPLATEERLRIFDQATARQRRRDQRLGSLGDRPADRGWKRGDLYDR
ncbi:MAG: AbrB/MazE/SpoVT family DNA-binding domain-containing protein [Acidobacteria bacterium]|nr:MAG: AbrB/MazE/SpoVT family DNA-binding domain-containing protein [Acidobacteriota bacterium]